MMGIGAESKGWLVWNVPREMYQIRRIVQVIKDMWLRPAMLAVRDQMTVAGLVVISSRVHMGQNVLGILQKFDPDREEKNFNDEVIVVSSVTVEN